MRGSLSMYAWFVEYVRGSLSMYVRGSLSICAWFVEYV